MKTNKDEYITLKQAAELSGYSPDYVGQLIRQGKLEGKQVYSNVAWVTTEEAVRTYMSGGNTYKAAQSVHVQVEEKLEDLEKVYKLIGRVLLVVLGLFALFLLYVLSVSIDDATQRALFEREASQIEL